jgi:hypothetical protein
MATKLVASRYKLVPAGLNVFKTGGLQALISSSWPKCIQNWWPPGITIISPIQRILPQFGVQLTANCQSSFTDLDLNIKIWIQPDWDPHPYHGFGPIMHLVLQYIIAKIDVLFSTVASQTLFSVICQNSASNGP